MTDRPQRPRPRRARRRSWPALEDLYRDVHEHPELSMQEHRTAGKAAERLRGRRLRRDRRASAAPASSGCWRNGDGPTVMLRADMDALPVREATGLPYASTATATDPDGNEVPVMHACGHDMHVTWLAGATALLAARPRRLAGHRAGGLPARRGDRAGRPGDDRRRPLRPLPQAGGHPRPARHARPGRARSATGPAPRRPPPTASRCGCSAAARTARCPSPASTRSSWPPRPSCACRRSSRARSPPARPRSSPIGALQAGTKDNVIPDEALLKLNVRTLRRAGPHATSWTRSSGSSRPRPRPPARRRPPGDHDDRALPADRQRPRPHRPRRRRAARPVRRRPRARAAPRRSPPARTSAPSAPSGASRRCSGTSAAPTPTPTARPSRPAASPRTSRRTTTPRFAPVIHPDARDRRAGHHRRRARRARDPRRDERCACRPRLESVVVAPRPAARGLRDRVGRERRRDQHEEDHERPRW